MSLIATLVVVGLGTIATTLWLIWKEIPANDEVKVHRILDGDTVIVVSGWRKQTIRLASIDCPEEGQDWNKNATAGLIKMIGGKTVKVDAHTKDMHGRKVATLHVFDVQSKSWINVNTLMVAKGHAWVHRNFLDHLEPRHKNELYRLERCARDKRVGLWCHSNPIPPWQWRQLK